MNAQTPKTATTRLLPRVTGAQGYRLSSDELRAGLEVRAVSLTTLPVELVSELVRMRRTWGDGFVSSRLSALV